MKEYADAIDFRLELTPDKVKELLEAGHIKGDEYLIRPVFINQDEKFSTVSPFNYSKSSSLLSLSDFLKLSPIFLPFSFR
jgi:hypothetical protein